MIRFACPSCNAVFTVADEKGGKAGKCPKCQAQFVIPEAEPGDSPAESTSPPPPPSSALAEPAPVPASNDIEIEPCPGCQAKLTVERDDLGKEVECPYCKTSYKAKDPNAKSKKSESKRVRDDDDDDDRPNRRKKDRFGEDRDDEYDDDIDDNRPSRRRRRRNSAPNPALAIVSLVFGIIALPMGLCCGLFAIPACLTAIITGGFGLNYSHRGMSLGGLVCGIIGLLMMVGMYILIFAGVFDGIIPNRPGRRF